MVWLTLSIYWWFMCTATINFELYLIGGSLEGFGPSLLIHQLDKFDFYFFNCHLLFTSQELVHKSVDRSHRNLFEIMTFTENNYITSQNLDDLGLQWTMVFLLKHGWSQHNLGSFWDSIIKRNYYVRSNFWFVNLPILTELKRGNLNWGFQPNDCLPVH